MILAAPARYSARRNQRWFLSDNATVFAPVIFWFLLVILGVGPQSLANIVEVLVIAVCSPLILTIRVFILDRLWPRPVLWSLLGLVVSLAITLILRLTMPLLPE